MRKLFAEVVLEEMKRDERFVVLTADIGYGLWDNVRTAYPDRFFNVGSAEQLMIGAAAGIAMEDKVPICYSITPFLLYRPFEFIRNFMNIEQLNIKIVGGGRGKDYGHLGYTHWAEEDLAVMSSLKNIVICRPEATIDCKDTFIKHLRSPVPTYINLTR